MLFFYADLNGAKTTPFIRSTLPPIEAKSKLNPSTNCKNNSDCKHIYGAQCNKRSKICVCKSTLPASDGKKCYNGKLYLTLENIERKFKSTYSYEQIFLECNFH